jgi:hypothetical protein
MSDGPILSELKAHLAKKDRAKFRSWWNSLSGQQKRFAKGAMSSSDKKWAKVAGVSL